MGRLLLLVASTLISLGLAEAAVRLLDLGPEIAEISAGVFRLSPNPVLQYDLQPGTHDGDVRVNDDGMRDRAFPLRKPPGTFRIAVIGDSVTYGFKVPDHQSYPKLLERLLEVYFGQRTTFEVLNFGVPGYSVPEIVESLRVKALRYDPDLVIYGYCLNDPELYNPFARTLRAGLAGRQRGYLERLAAGNLRLYALARYVLDASRLPPPPADQTAVWDNDPGNLAVRSGPRAYEAYIARLHRHEPSWAVVTDGFEELGRMARTQGMPIAVAVFPLMRRLEPYTLGRVHRKLTRAAEERGLLAVDLTAPFEAAEADPRFAARLSLDVAHPRPGGHGIAALALLFWLLDNDLVPGGDSSGIDRLLSEQPAAAMVRSALAAPAA